MCPLCNGLFRDANTITECNHTFCKECIVNYIYDLHTTCPTCNLYLGRNPFNYLRYFIILL